MTSKEIETSLKEYTDGAIFISKSQLSKALGKANFSRDILPIVKGLDQICYDTTTDKGKRSGKYFIPDVAKRLNNMKVY